MLRLKPPFHDESEYARLSGIAHYLIDGILEHAEDVISTYIDYKYEIAPVRLRPTQQEFEIH